MGTAIGSKNMNANKPCEKCLVIASSNLGKINEFRELLSCVPLKLLSMPEGLDVEETGQTFAENARLKAIKVAEITGEWALADDSGLSVNSLAGSPGVHSARYEKSDDARIHRLLSEMEPFDDRSAYFSSAICIAAPNNEILLEVEGKCHGIIAKEGRGEKGFGYDPIFEVLNTGLTFAEMGAKEKQVLSHRGLAFALLKPKLRKLLNE